MGKDCRDHVRVLKGTLGVMDYILMKIVCKATGCSTAHPRPI